MFVDDNRGVDPASASSGTGRLQPITEARGDEVVPRTVYIPIYSTVRAVRDLGARRVRSSAAQ